jgi:uncharacterized protein
MSALFFDSSALVKRYLTEIGSTWVAAQINPGSNNVIVIAEITRVEVAAALAADDDLLAAARAEGLAAENPNQHA